MSFQVLFLNVQGLPGKEVHLEIQDIEMNIDVICLAEHWLQNNENVVLQNFFCAAKYARCNHIRGGTAIYIKTKYLNSVRERTDLANLSLELHFEICGVEVSIRDVNVIIITVYRSNNITSDIEIFFDRLEQALQIVSRPGSVLILAGDLNIDKRDDDRDSRRLSNLIRSFNLVCTTDDYTRVTDTTKSKIDYIITNRQQSDFKAEVLPCQFSDHMSIAYKTYIGCNNQNGLYGFRRLGSESSFARFFDYLAGETWEEVYRMEGPDGGLDVFLAKFMLFYNECFPRKCVKLKRGDCRWVTSEVKRAKQKLMDLYAVKMSHPGDRRVAEIYKFNKKQYDNWRKTQRGKKFLI